MTYIALSIGDKGQPTYNVGVPSQIANLVNNWDLQSLIRFGITFALSIAVLLSFFFVLFGGFKWMLSQGDKKQVDEAQKTITYAIIGLIVALLSFFILNLVGFAFRVPLT